MCGIVGYVGSTEAVDFLITGLRRLEYRGYDSAGIATITPANDLVIAKSVGRIERLEQQMAEFVEDRGATIFLVPRCPGKDRRTPLSIIEDIDRLPPMAGAIDNQSTFMLVRKPSQDVEPIRLKRGVVLPDILVDQRVQPPLERTGNGSRLSRWGLLGLSTRELGGWCAAAVSRRSPKR